MEEDMIENMVIHSKEDVERLQLQREYYVTSVVKDIKKFAPNIKFSSKHEGVNGVIPYPTTVIHDLTALYSKRTDVKFFLYSEYPFLNRKDRVLSPFQKKAIKMVEKSTEGIYYQKDFINGKEVLRVAVADYMTKKACVECHNHSSLRNWKADKWKLGDKRGVLEIITPIDLKLAEMQKSRNKIVFIVISIMLLLIIYYSYVLLKREKELTDENDKLNDDFNDLFEDFDKYVIASRTDLKGNITYVSNHFCSVSGYTKEELLGNNHKMLRHPEMADELFKDLWKTISSKESWEGEIKNRKKDGSCYWVKANISPLYNNGEHVGYVAIRFDITNKKKINDLNRSLQEKIDDEISKSRKKDQQIIQQARLAQMGEMISMIAHQWRQPLSAISGSIIAIQIKLSRKKFDLDDEKGRADFLSFLDRIHGDIKEYVYGLSETIDDFRNFFRPDKRKEHISITEPINRALKIVATSMSNKSIEIECDFQTTDTIMLYKNEIMQVILNILKNAEDNFAEKKIENAKIEIKTLKENDQHIILIADNGGGISNSILPKIFDPYFSTKGEKNGTGLGLYMSKTMIEEHHNGELSVTNSKDGAVFKIVLIDDKLLTR